MKACFLRAVDCLALRSGASSMNSHEQRHRCNVLFWLARVLRMRATVQRPFVLASEMFRGQLTICRCVACKWNQHVPSTQSKFLGHVLIGNAHFKCHGTHVSLRSSTLKKRAFRDLGCAVCRYSHTIYARPLDLASIWLDTGFHRFHKINSGV